PKGIVARRITRDPFKRQKKTRKVGGSEDFKEFSTLSGAERWRQNATSKILAPMLATPLTSRRVKSENEARRNGSAILTSSVAALANARGGIIVLRNKNGCFLESACIARRILVIDFSPWAKGPNAW